MRSLELAIITVIMVIIFLIVTFTLIPKRVDLDPIAKYIAYEVSNIHGVEVLNIGIPAIVELYENRTLIVRYEDYISKVELPENVLFSLRVIRSYDMGPIIKIYGKLHGNEVLVWIGVKLEEGLPS